VTAGYGRSAVLRDVSISVEAGEVVALLGPNGAGKSTLIKTIAGLLRPRAGQIHLGGSRIDGRRPHEIARLGVAVVPEGRRVFAYLTVAENLLLAGHGRRDRQGVKEDLEFLYGAFPALKERAAAMGNQLSGGQQQMVALGRAVMQRPKLILMDEPSIGLSPVLVQQLSPMIRRIQERTGAAILIVEQDAPMALELASRAYVLRGGRLVFSGGATELSDVRTLAEMYLGAG
jgi:branched-chain amino acid transport system ATP-binding protein